MWAGIAWPGWSTAPCTEALSHSLCTFPAYTHSLFTLTPSHSLFTQSLPAHLTLHLLPFHTLSFHTPSPCTLVPCCPVDTPSLCTPARHAHCTHAPLPCLLLLEICSPGALIPLAHLSLCTLISMCLFQYALAHSVPLSTCCPSVLTPLALLVPLPLSVCLCAPLAHSGLLQLPHLLLVHSHFPLVICFLHTCSPLVHSPFPYTLPPFHTPHSLAHSPFSSALPLPLHIPIPLHTFLFTKSHEAK